MFRFRVSVSRFMQCLVKKKKEELKKKKELITSSRADEMFEAASLTAASIEKSPYTSNAEDSAFNLRFGTSPYKWYAENPKRGARFASAMAGYVQSSSFILSNLYLARD